MKEETKEEKEEEEEEETVPGSTLFIKNLNFSTTEEQLQEVGQFISQLSHVLVVTVTIFIIFSSLLQVFTKCGNVKSCSISKKKDKSGTSYSNCSQSFENGLSTYL